MSYPIQDRYTIQPETVLRLMDNITAATAAQLMDQAREIRDTATAVYGKDAPDMAAAAVFYAGYLAATMKRGR